MTTTIGIAAPPAAGATKAHATAALAAVSPWSDGTCLPNLQSRPLGTSWPASTAPRWPPPASARLRYGSAHIGEASGGSGTANAFSRNETSV
jgi:hypothetical protein